MEASETLNQVQIYSEKAIDLLFDFGPKIIGAVVILILGLWAIRLITKAVKKALRKSKIDESLVPFLSSLISTLLKALLILSVLGVAGIEVTSFIAILGAAGLAVGMALSGTLQNFAGGVMILVLKPFKVGDFIEAQGYIGSVDSIQIFSTVLKTPDNKVIIIPNGGLSTSSMINYSNQETRRVDWTFGIAYGDDYDVAKNLLMKFIQEDSRIKDTPAPFIVLGALADSSVNIIVRVWVVQQDYWNVLFDMNERVYKEFPKHNLNIPFPQMDVHLKKA